MDSGAQGASSKERKGRETDRMGGWSSFAESGTEGRSSWDGVKDSRKRETCHSPQIPPRKKASCS